MRKNKGIIGIFIALCLIGVVAYLCSGFEGLKTTFAPLGNLIRGIWKDEISLILENYLTSPDFIFNIITSITSPFNIFLSFSSGAIYSFAEIISALWNIMTTYV